MTLTGDMTFSGGSIAYDMGLDPNDPNGNDLVLVTGQTSISGGGTISPNFLAGTPASGLTYTVLTSSGGFSDSLAGWSVNWFGRGTAPTVVVSGNDLQFTTTDTGAEGGHPLDRGR